MNRLTWITFLLAFSLSVHASAPLETVPHVDLDRYLGDWYEIARFEDISFQRDCYATKANYSLREDGDIRVLNSCRVGSVTGKSKKAEGRAWVVDQKTNSKLKVQFFLRGIRLPFAAGDYWIIELDEDYQYVMVGSPSRDYLWILSRSTKLPESIYQYLIGRAEEMGFDTKKLIGTIH